MNDPRQVPPLSPEESRQLLDAARASIRHGLEFGQPPEVALSRYGPGLTALGACFVSLHRGDELRGCIGTIKATRPLVHQAAESAYAAAFRDPRFAPLCVAELADLSLEIHALGALEAIAFDGAEALYRQLRRDVDGLVLEQHSRQSVFLPVMWKLLPEPEAFVRQLMQKGGISGWQGLRASRFTAEVICGKA